MKIPKIIKIIMNARNEMVLSANEVDPVILLGILALWIYFRFFNSEDRLFIGSLLLRDMTSTSNGVELSKSKPCFSG